MLPSKLLAAAAISVACTQAPSPEGWVAPTATEEDSPEQLTRPLGFYPQWEAGDRWTVRFAVPTERSSRRPPNVLRTDYWDFEIVSADASGDVEIRAHGPEGSEQMRFTIDRRGKIFHLEHRGPQPWAPFYAMSSDSQAFLLPVEQWPTFPLVPEVQYVNSDSFRVQEMVRDGDAFLVFVRDTNEYIDSRDLLPPLIQRWEPGRPWWSAYIEGQAGLPFLFGEVVKWDGWIPPEDRILDFYWRPATAEAPGEVP